MGVGKQDEEEFVPAARVQPLVGQVCTPRSPAGPAARTASLFDQLVKYFPPLLPHFLTHQLDRD